MIIIRSPGSQQIRKANVVVAEILERLRALVVPGVTTDELDGISEDIILSKGAVPAFKGYRGYPKTLCVSINEEVVHGIPNKRKLKEGDIVSIDVGTNLHGYFGDSAITLPVEDHPEAKRLGGDEKALSIGSKWQRWEIVSSTFPMLSGLG
jgi:methionyl aminopeptidase